MIERWLPIPGYEGRQQFAAENFSLTEDQDMIAQIGAQAGLHAAMQVLAERGWIRVEVGS